MSSLGNIKITQPLRRVKFKRNANNGWLHGFFQEKDTVIALVELDNGMLVKEYPEEIQFAVPYTEDEAG